MKTIITENLKEKLKSKSKKIEPKIINSFWIYKFLTSYLYKSRKIIDYYYNIMLANYFIR